MEQVKYDTIYRRFLAKIIDYILLLTVGYILTVFLPPTTYSFDIDNTKIPQNTDSVLNFWTSYGDLVLSIILIIYFVAFHFFGGQTPGKMITGVKVWDMSENKKITFKQSFLRSLPDISFALITFLFSYEYLPLVLICLWNIANLIQVFPDKKHRTINDLIAKSIVLKTSDNTIKN
ncbi:RDD family protein [Chryseobacterium sp. MOF25P]|uniref:RDD family protein n=1 Tax=unclassified Chryseobacterium TaxID=2593645 RepID=UPI000804D9B5|nr:MULTISPECIES: RDD family protein [unclassified Chryseobacterium]OBW40939.1 RDD family protein [Chryseobacterium sp. MOF25P]OBW47669.1 RDD family protein [Chryseobacterium sp. BGARF1]